MIDLLHRCKAWLARRLGAIKPVASRAVLAGTVGQNDRQDDPKAAQHLVPYDENLLERSRTQWQFGDWERLAATGMPPPALAGARMGIATYTVEPLQS